MKNVTIGRIYCNKNKIMSHKLPESHNLTSTYETEALHSIQKGYV